MKLKNECNQIIQRLWFQSRVFTASLQIIKYRIYTFIWEKYVKDSVSIIAELLCCNSMIGRPNGDDGLLSADRNAGPRSWLCQNGKLRSDR